MHLVHNRVVALNQLLHYAMRRRREADNGRYLGLYFIQREPIQLIWSTYLVDRDKRNRSPQLNYLRPRTVPLDHTFNDLLLKLHQWHD